MKKLLIALVLLLGFVSETRAAKNLTYLEEMQQLGDVAGQGLGCRARKYQKYELLARAILVAKAPDDKTQQQGMITYNSAKVDAFASILDNNYDGCSTIINSFNQQKIFQSVLYADGKIKLYDGTLLTPRKLYGASSLYKADPQIYDKAVAAYKKALANAKKNRQNAPKLEFRDSNYSRYANQFN